MFGLVCIVTTISERQVIWPVEKFCGIIGRLKKPKSSNVTLISHLAFFLFLLSFVLSLLAH